MQSMRHLPDIRTVIDANFRTFLALSQKRRTTTSRMELLRRYTEEYTPTVTLAKLSKSTIPPTLLECDLNC